MSEIKIILKKSLIGQKKNRVATAHSIGLNKINSETVQPDNGPTRGKIRIIDDLIYTEAVAEVKK